MSETAIVIVVPEADNVVSRWQRTLTQAGRNGLAAHITLLYPFADSVSVADRLDDLRRALAPFAPFECTFRDTAYFERPGGILYLRPEPRDILVAMIDSVVAVFPEFPAHGGDVSSIVPHLTVARKDDDAELLRAIEEELTTALPIQARIDTATIVEHVSGAGWREHLSLPLG